MTFLPIYRYRAFGDPFQELFGNQLAFFDPWKDYKATEMILPSSFRWINEPLCFTRRRLKSRLNENFRVQINVDGFNPETIQTKIEGKKLIVQAKHEDRQADGDFNYREMRKSYDLPEHADMNNVVSFVTSNNMLVIEVPIRDPEVERKLVEAQAEASKEVAQFGQYRDPIFDYVGFLNNCGFHQRIVEIDDKGQKQLQILLPMKNAKPDMVKVSVKDNQLTVQCESSYKDETCKERSFFRKSITLPPGTQVDQLQSQITDNGEIKIEAPYVEPTQQ
ncbi:unnamed protein product [Rotaria socialis]|uniref:SHSP domain-containing protein n=1 Tax=Rotaria socialis TaxID=392032 RepID=A0A818MLX5_9BILA|nr:unnamed protein product [Rotaria socialis]CAF3413197.1 unnamed protein product [Rotaria socialis]CAF3517649.1 unnamed protein product [Rotaria socialis]CAF3561660.1 unnamed protein product [Rotaria socialis]CAF3591396.1 unnamed protein product [Rotaria socialis]